MANQEGSGTGRFGEAIGSAMSGYAGKLRGATDLAGGKLVESVGHAVGSTDIAQEGARQRQQGQSEWTGTARDRLPAPGPEKDTTVGGGNRDLGPQGYAAQGASDRQWGGADDRERLRGSGGAQGLEYRDTEGQGMTGQSGRDMQGGRMQGGGMQGQGMQGQGMQGQGWDDNDASGNDVGMQSSMDAGDVQGSRDVGARGGQGYPSTQNASRW